MDRNPTRGRRAARLATLAAAALGALAASATLEATELTAAQPFVLPGAPVEITLAGGTPGARYVAIASPTPAYVVTAGLGTLYLAPGTFQVLGGGVLDGAGAATRALNAPPGLATGDRLYVQVLELAASRRLTNAVAFRFEDALPTGQRAPRALALTPDGTRAYVVHQVDGTVTVVDAVGDVAVRELPITTGARSVPHRPVDVAVSPDGQLAFVLSATADFIAVVETATDSVVAEIPVPRGSRRVAFDFAGTERRVYVTNEVNNAVLVFRQNGPGSYTRLADLRTLGRMPGALAVLPGGRLVVGQRVVGELELLDPLAAPGQQTLARRVIDGVPQDLALGPDGNLRVATFVLSTQVGTEGANRVLRVDPASLAVLGVEFENVGTDYKALASDGAQLLAVAATGNGVALLGDGAGNVLDLVDLAPGEPNATPEDVEFVFDADGNAERLYVLDFFRETLRPVALTSGPPYALGAQIPLAWAGAPRVPFTAATSDVEDGLYLFLSVGLVGGDAADPNLVTCQSCHTDGVSDNLLRGRQVPTMWGLTETAPYGSTGGQPDLSVVVGNAINRHNGSGAPPVVPNAQALFEDWLGVFQPPPSIYLKPDGSLTDDAAAGQLVFESIGCTDCHAAPLFIPVPPNPLTIAEGIGTGLVPANVPSLRGAWSSAPYLHDGSRRTLRDVLVGDPTDGHGLLAAGLTQTELTQLIAYLRSL